MGVPLLVLNSVGGMFIAYKWFYSAGRSEDKIARLILTSSITATAVALNALLVAVYVTEIKFAHAVLLAAIIDVATYLPLQIALLRKVDLSK